MKAIVFHGIGDIRLDEVPEPTIEQPTDAIVRRTTSAICGTDLHFDRGTFEGVDECTILGHEGVGIAERTGEGVRDFKVGDRVAIPSTVACGYYSYVRAGYYAQSDNANPNGPDPGTVFYGGPKAAGGLNGMQAEKVHVPFASVDLVKLPDEVNDEQAIPISDIFPTGYFGEISRTSNGDMSWRCLVRPGRPVGDRLGEADGRRLHLRDRLFRLTPCDGPQQCAESSTSTRKTWSKSSSP
jgi:threonine dehydrogenase-like Zn-dependent dehydrogenase